MLCNNASAPGERKGSGRGAGNLWTFDVAFFVTPMSRSASSRRRLRRAQHVAGVAARVFNEILLVVFFGGIEFSSSGDFGGYRAVEFAGFIPPGFHALGGLLLSFARVEDGGAVLRAHVIVLTVEGGWIVHAKEVIQKGFI